MKHLGYLKTIDLHLLQDEDGDLYVSRNSYGGDGVYIAFPSSSDGGRDLDDVFAEIRALTEDPTARLVAAVRAAVAEFHNPDGIELDLTNLSNSLAAFDAAVEARQ